MVSPKASGGTAWGNETLETIWEVPDELWERIEPIILEEDPPKARGRKRSDPRQMASSSGCERVPWNRQTTAPFRRWVGSQGCEELDGRGRRQTEPWARHAADRGKAGTKRSLLVDGRAAPHCGCGSKRARQAVGGATPLWSNDHRPRRTVWTKGMTILQAVGLPPHGYREHIRRIGEEKRPLATSGSRWVVELVQVPCGPGVRQAANLGVRSSSCGGDRAILR